MKRWFKFKDKRSLRIVVLDPRTKGLELEEFNDVFDVFNFLAEKNITRYSIHCYDPKKAHLLLVIEG